MRKVVLLFLLVIPASSFCQNEEKSTQKTKIDEFESKTGSIIKFWDTKLPSIKGGFTAAETRVRKISTNATTGYFYQIVKKGEYSNKTASIEYSDLLEVIKALKILIEESKDESQQSHEYLENKFVTEDGFQVGYFANKGKITWYITLEKYGSGNTVFVNDATVIGSAFLEAKSTIEALKQQK